MIARNFSYARVMQALAFAICISHGSANDFGPRQLAEKKARVVAISAGWFSMLLKSDGTVWMAGQNKAGQLGLGNKDTMQKFTKVPNLSGITAIGAGRQMSMVLKDDGTVWSAGKNANGQLGDGTTTDRMTFVQAKGVKDAKAISLEGTSAMILKKDGTVMNVGWNLYGQLGDGTKTDRHTYAQVKDMSNVVAINCANAHSYLLKDDGSLWITGTNWFGQLGDPKLGVGKTIIRPTFTKVLDGVKALAENVLMNTIVIKNDDSAWGVGHNGFAGSTAGAMLGLGKDIGVTKTWVKLGNDVKAVTGAGLEVFMLKKDGTVWAAGRNNDGQLGIGSKTPIWTFVKTSAGSDIVAVTAAALAYREFTLVLTKDGTVRFAGSNDHGQMGKSSPKESLSFVDIVEGVPSCEASDCAAKSKFTKDKFADIMCSAKKCTESECCDDKTCANGGTDRKAVTCGSAFTAKAGSTKCTTCAKDGTECCRKQCTISTVGSIKFDASKTKVTLATGGKQMDIAGLKYAYNECVDPSSVTFEAFQLNSLGFCDLGKSLSSVAKFTGTPVSKTADMALKIIELNSKSLGAAYSFSGGATTIELCVRARMRGDGQDILFTENNFVIKYSNGGFSVDMNVDRKKNAVVNQDLGALFKVTAFQCDDKYQTITAAILPDKPVLRICVKGESNKFVCDNIATATLKQPGNGITEDKIIVDGTPKSPKYTEVAKKDEFCMLTAHLRAEYFAKKTSSSSLQVVVEGSAAMRNKARRQLKDADDQSPDDKFEISVEIGESGGEPQSTTTWVMGKEVDKDAAVGVYNLALGTAMIIFMLI